MRIIIYNYKAVAVGVRRNSVPMCIYILNTPILPPPSGGVRYIYRRSKNREKDLFVDLTHTRTQLRAHYLYI